MSFSIPRLARTAATAVLAATALAAVAAPASADVACNRWGECWHVHDHYTAYPPALGVMFHDERWAAHHHRHLRWRQDRPDDHGYYQHGAWRPF